MTERAYFCRQCVIVVMLAALVLLVSACSTVERALPEFLPTARYCHEVLYHRSERDVTIQAQCKAPFSGM